MHQVGLDSNRILSVPRTVCVLPDPTLLALLVIYRIKLNSVCVSRQEGQVKELCTTHQSQWYTELYTMVHNKVTIQVYGNIRAYSSYIHRVIRI